jgi:hypothetical protein
MDARPQRNPMKIVRAVGMALGLASVGYLIAFTGVETLLIPIQTLSWRVAVFIIFPYTFVAVLRTLAWRFAFPRTRVPWRRLFSVRLAGEALNFGTASVGGEPVKAYLLQPSVSLVEASTAQLVDKTSITIAQVLFLGLGLAVACPLFDLPSDFRRAMGALLGIQILAVGAFVFVQRVGMLGRGLRLLQWLGVRGRGPRAEGLISVDRALAASYRRRPGAVLGCIAIHFLGWVVGSLEVYLVLTWLGVSTSFTSALVIDAFGTGVKFMAFAVPGALGVLEGGYMLAFSAVGLGSGLGLSFTLVRRLRMVIWSALGLVVLVVLRSSARRARDQDLARRSALAPRDPDDPEQGCRHDDAVLPRR